MPPTKPLQHPDDLTDLIPTFQRARPDFSFALLSIPSFRLRLGEHLIPPWEQQIPGDQSEPRSERVGFYQFQSFSSGGQLTFILEHLLELCFGNVFRVGNLVHVELEVNIERAEENVVDCC